MRAIARAKEEIGGEEQDRVDDAKEVTGCLHESLGTIGFCRDV